MSPRVVDRLGVLTQKVSGLQRKVSDVEYGLDVIVGELRDLQGNVAAGPLAVAGSAAAGRMPDTLLRLLAEKGVAAITLVRGGQTSVLRIDGGEPIPLSEALADLAEVLLADGGGDGPLIGWQPFDAIEAALAKRRGRRPGRGALRTLIYRLRQHLRAAGENPFLVQVAKGRGARFALRRPRPPEGGAAGGG